MISKFITKYKNMPLEIKASTAYTICSILLKSLSFITLPLFTRLLTTTEYGQYTVYSSWQSILIIFISLNLPYGTFMTAMVKFKDERNQYVSSICSIFLILGIISFLLYFPFKNILNIFFELPTYMMIFMLIEIIAVSSTECWMAQCRYEFKYKSVVLITIIKAILSPFLAFLLVIIFDQKGYARILGYSLVTIIIGIFLIIKIYKNGKTFFNKKFWKYAFSFNIPLIPYYLSQMIFNTSDRIMISNICGIDKAGIYGVAYSLALMLNFVISAINNSYAPWFFDKIGNNEEKQNVNVSNVLSAIVAIGLFIIIICTPEIVLLMAGKNYYEAIFAVPPVAISVLLLFYTQLFDRVLFFYERKYLLVFSSIIPSVLNIILNLIYIPRFGFIAASYTTLISYILFALINYYFMKHVLNKAGKVCNLFNINVLLIILMALCIATIIAVLLYDSFIIRFFICAILGCLVLINKNRIISFYKNIWN